MKRKYWGLLAGLVILVTGIGILSWPSFPLEMGLRTDKEVYDLGNVKPGTLRTSTKVWNMSLKPIKIEEVRACCGSTAKFHNGNKSTVIPPLHYAQVDVSFQAFTGLGPQLKMIELRVSRGKEQAFAWLSYQFAPTR